MIKDDADTDFVCKSTVSAFTLSNEKLRVVEKKRQDLSIQRNLVKQKLYAPLYPLALDYIFHNNNTQTSEDAYLQTLRTNQLKVKFKNAIMQRWTQIKLETKQNGMQDMINQMLKDNRSSKKEGIKQKL